MKYIGKSLFIIGMLWCLGVCVWILIDDYKHPAPTLQTLQTPKPPVSAQLPTPPPSSTNELPKLLPLKFDLARRDREYDWCVEHGGVPTMTFDDPDTHTNVLCLRRSAIIELPK